MMEHVRNSYQKNIPVKFKKNIWKYFPSYRVEKLAHTDGQTFCNQTSNEWQELFGLQR